jgi:hypothetical protein
LLGKDCTVAAKLTALYYPHIGIDNSGLLKNALLLWDRVELICPLGQLPHSPSDVECQRAFAAISHPLRPSHEEMLSAHEAILEIANSALPKWFFPEHTNKHLRYQLYPGKFLPETWEALQQTRLTKPVMTDIEPPMPRSQIAHIYGEAKQAAFETTQAFGLTMMSILADVCAAGTRQLVTDEVDSYTSLDRYLKLIGGSRPVGWRKAAHERLVTLSVMAADLSNVPLSTLVDIRQREAKEPRLRTMRHHYAGTLEAYIQQLATDARSARDVAEIERQFIQDIDEDIAVLKEELKDEGKKVLLSNELMGAAAIAAAGAFVQPALAAALAAGALYRTKVEYSTARNKTLERHAMSWLYEMRRFKPY